MQKVSSVATPSRVLPSIKNRVKRCNRVFFQKMSSAQVPSEHRISFFLQCFLEISQNAVRKSWMKAKIIRQQNGCGKKKLSVESILSCSWSLEKIIQDLLVLVNVIKMRMTPTKVSCPESKWQTNWKRKIITSRRTDFILFNDKRGKKSTRFRLRIISHSQYYRIWWQYTKAFWTMSFWQCLK